MKMNCPSGTFYTIDIPSNQECHYQGSLGHKVNHSFNPNSIYIPYDSARYFCTVHWPNQVFSQMLSARSQKRRALIILCFASEAIFKHWQSASLINYTLDFFKSDHFLKLMVELQACTHAQYHLKGHYIQKFLTKYWFPLLSFKDFIEV